MFYTNATLVGNNILLRQVKNGKRMNSKIPYSPKLYTKSNNKTGWKTIHEEYLEELPFSDIYEAKDFCKKYADIPNFEIFGMTNYTYAFISDNYKGKINWNMSDICVAYTDIEVDSSNGFPNPDTADSEITAITMIVGDRTLAFGLPNYKKHKENVEYFKCTNEVALLESFISYWTLFYPDIVTGWNSKQFDIPYLVNRIRRLLGDEAVNKLSPWGKVSQYKTEFRGKESISYDILGVMHLDYYELYRKFSPAQNQENFKLDTIAGVELGDSKVDYAALGYKDLTDLYERNPQLYIEYNIKDTEIVVRLEEKLKLIELALTIAYDAKINYEDVFSPVKTWDVIIYNYLKENGYIIPPNNKRANKQAYDGAYVKDPVPGFYKWISSFDYESLYPKLIMMYNISPETLIEPYDYTEQMYEIVSGQTINVDAIVKKTVDTSKLKELGVTLTPNGQLFNIQKDGFLPVLMKRMFNDRKMYKNKMLECERELQEVKKEMTKRGL